MTNSSMPNTRSSSAVAVVAESPTQILILRELAARAMGMTGADIERIVRDARLRARREKRPLSIADLEAELRTSGSPLSSARRHLHAVHEAGHILVHHVLKLGPILGVTIDGPDGAHGTVQFDPDRSNDPDIMDDTLAMLLAGRAAELVAFGHAGSGSGGAADSDLARATNLAIKVERTWGLGQDLPLLYRPPSDNTALLDQDQELAERIHGWLETAQARAIAIISDHRTAFDALVAKLVERQALEGAEVIRILDARDV